MPRSAHSRTSAGLSGRAKLLATVTAVGATAAVAGLGTFGGFTSTTAAETPTYATGTVVLDYGPGGTTNRLNVGATAMAPGDTAQRGFTLRNSGTINMASTTLAITASPTSALDTDGTDGLKVGIQSCSGVGWVESLTTPYTYTCAGTVTTVLAATAVSAVKASPQTLSNLASLTAGSSDNLMATFTLPSTAGNSFQGLTSTLSLSFTGTQRTAAAK